MQIRSSSSVRFHRLNLILQLIAADLQPDSIYARLSRRSVRKRDFYARPSSQQIISNSCLREIDISYTEKKLLPFCTFVAKNFTHPPSVPRRGLIVALEAAS